MSDYAEIIFASIGIDIIDDMLYEVERIMALDEYFNLPDTKIF